MPAWAIIRDTKAEIVVAEFSMYLTSTYKLVLRRLAMGRPKLVFWTHGFAMHRSRDGLTNRLLDRTRLVLLRCADAVICYSDEGRDYLARSIAPSRLFVVHNTIDIEPMRRLRAELGPPPRTEGPHLLAVGRMTRDKRFPALVRVFRLLLEAFPQARLTIFGDGPDMPAVRAAAEGIPEGRLILPGLVYDEAALAPHFLSADLFVFAGSVGLSVNHALAYGLPVVTYRRTPQGPFHHPEIAYVVDGVTGWLVEPYTDEAMAERLAAILREHPRPAAELRGVIDRYVDDNLRIERMVEDFARLYAAVSGEATGSEAGRR